jgi:hypothetical protein
VSLPGRSLLSGKRSPVLIAEEAGWTSELVWTEVREKNTCPLPEIELRSSSLSSVIIMTDLPSSSQSGTDEVHTQTVMYSRPANRENTRLCFASMWWQWFFGLVKGTEFLDHDSDCQLVKDSDTGCYRTMSDVCAIANSNRMNPIKETAHSVGFVWRLLYNYICSWTVHFSMKLTVYCSCWNTDKIRRCKEQSLVQSCLRGYTAV